MSYEPSFSKRPGGVAARPRFFSLLGLGSDASDSGAPALKVIIDDESNPSSSRDAESAVSLLHTLDSAGDQGVARDSSFPPKPQTPTKNQQAVSPVAQKFGRRAGSENKPKSESYSICIPPPPPPTPHDLICVSHFYTAALSPSKSNQLKESPASLPSNHHGQAAGPKNNSSQKTPQKPNSPQHLAKGLSPAKQNQPQPLQPTTTTNENEAPTVSSSVVSPNAPSVSSSVISPNVASMKPSNVKFGFSKFGFSFSKPKVASPKPVKSVIPSALGSPIAAAIATPRLHEHESVQEASSAAVNAVEISSLNSVPLEAPAAIHVTATAAANAPTVAPDVPSDAKPHLIVGLSSRAQQLMAELAAEDQSFGALDFLEPVKKEKRVLIEKSNLVRKNVKSGPRHPAPFASVLKSDFAEPVSSRANMMKSAAPQTHVSAAGTAPTAAASAAAPADPKQVEHLKRTIDNLRAQLDAARNHEKKVVTLENQLAEQNGLVESMRKEIRQAAPDRPVVASSSSRFTGCISDRRCCSSVKKQSVSRSKSNSIRS
jgi:hypothetical protein